jgi:hypothetical protein
MSVRLTPAAGWLPGRPGSARICARQSIGPADVTDELIRDAHPPRVDPPAPEGRHLIEQHAERPVSSGVVTDWDPYLAREGVRLLWILQGGAAR